MQLPAKPFIAVNITWTTSIDFQRIADIEQDSFEDGRDAKQVEADLRPTNRISMTAIHYERTVGFILYELYKNRIEIVRFAVHPDFRRQGVGRQLLDKLKGKLSTCRRRTLTLDVRETNLAAQLFLKKQGFRAYRVARNHYDDPQEDAYFMQYALCDAVMEDACV